MSAVSASAMGLVSSLMRWVLGSGGDEDKPDPATGLSPRQKNLIVSSWRLMGKKRAENGVAFFIMLFEKFPPLVKYFPQFDGKSRAELETDPTMRAHAITVMFSIGSLVENLEDPECLVKLAEKIATNHLKRKVNFSAFDDLREMFADFLEARLGSQATPEIKQAWYHLLGVLNSVVRAQAAKMGQPGTSAEVKEVKS